ncbi:MAG: FecR domain-containing protein [Acidobacteria bacterium]|nr:FecR domain-containing protein [Acidobacteriota bacterium]MBV9477802.1 FecR domain-containing protein [Acidobacteriota bacterium]
MRKAISLTLLTLITAIALPSHADERDRNQSFISFDDGGTVVKSGDDGREIDAQRNLPVYPGDEVVTSRRGRAEVRLSDGNVLGIDRATSVLFRSILDSYEGDADETVAELKYGKIAVQRTDLGHDHVRLDTENASYVANNEAIYSVETDTRGRDRVTVFEGNVEVRTPRRSSRLRNGESATVDNDGVYDLIGDQRGAADDFERWFLNRADKLGSYNSRYVDRRLGYYTDDLDEYGSWVNVSGIGWSWRPHVAVGWRPYYNGYWYHSRSGCLTWVSYDPWGWGPYHYGRWTLDTSYGWVWAPGYSYSPAWVYWAYGPSYIGWAPSGYWDCYRPYYDWAYRPYRRGGFDAGFYGRIRFNEVDLRPWTFVDSRGLTTNRIDRAALTTDVIRQRIRGNEGVATVSGGAARFTREEFRDPADAIRHRALEGRDGRTTGRETGAGSVGQANDLTPFFRRDDNLSGNLRDRIVRSRGNATPVAGGAVAPSRGNNGGGLAPIGGGSVAPIGGGSVAPIGRGETGERPSNSSDPGRINRGTWRGGNTTPRDTTQPGDAPRPTRIERPERGGDGNIGRDTVGRDNGSGSSWRDRIRDRGTDTPQVTPAPDSATAPSSDRSRGSDSWRNRPHDEAPRAGEAPSPSSTRGSDAGSSDVPRRVIDRIGGARVYPRDSEGSRPSRDTSTRESTPPPSRDRGSSTRDSGSRDSGSSSRDRSSSPPPSRSNDSVRSNSGNSGHRESGGRIRHD